MAATRRRRRWSASSAQIADVTEMTSSSSLGSTRITLQFDLDRDIDGAARDVQAAINAARADLPTSLRSNPTYRKVNPADAPIMILALTSTTLTPGQIYDAASTVLQQKLSQVDGVGQVDVGGSSLPAVRVELNPRALFKYGIGLEDVRAALAAANANSPKGAIEDGDRHWQIYANDQATHGRGVPAAGRRLPQRRARSGSPTSPRSSIRSRTCATPASPTASRRSASCCHRQPGANIIETVDRVKAVLPRLARGAAGRRRPRRRRRPHDHHPRLAARHRAHAGDRRRAGDPGRVRLPAQRARRR